MTRRRWLIVIFVGLISMVLSEVSFGKHVYAAVDESKIMEKWAFAQYYTCMRNGAYFDTINASAENSNNYVVQSMLYDKGIDLDMPSYNFQNSTEYSKILCSEVLGGVRDATGNEIKGLASYVGDGLNTVKWNQPENAKETLNTFGYTLGPAGEDSYSLVLNMAYSEKVTVGDQVAANDTNANTANIIATRSSTGEPYRYSVMNNNPAFGINLAINGTTLRISTDGGGPFGPLGWCSDDYVEQNIEVQLDPYNINTTEANIREATNGIEWKRTCEDSVLTGDVFADFLARLGNSNIANLLSKSRKVEQSYIFRGVEKSETGGYVFNRYNVNLYTELDNITRNFGTTIKDNDLTNSEKYDLYYYYLKNSVPGVSSKIICSPSEEQKQGFNKNTKEVRLKNSSGSMETCYVNFNTIDPATITVTTIDIANKYPVIRTITIAEILEWFNNVNPATLADVDGSTDLDQQEQASGENEDRCYSPNANAGSLAWILCPLTQGVSDALSGIYGQIVEPFLVVEPALLDTSSGTHVAWEAVINVANTVLVIFLLVIIFSQLTGVGIDNYGIKKSLPKVVIAAVLINLSFIICQLAVDVSNIVGSSVASYLSNIEVGGLGEMASAAAGGSTQWFNALFYAMSGGLVVMGAASVVTSVMATGIFSTLVLPLLLFLIVALVAVFFFFILLGVRKAAVVLLVVVAPLAFVCYMLPNTKKWFDRWVKAMEGMLLLYPLCGFLLGGGQLVSKILISASTDSIMYFIACVVLVVPFFFIPTLLKGSFKAIGGIGGKISTIGRNIGKRSRDRVGNGVRNTNWYKARQNEFARNAQLRSARRTVDRLKGRANLNDRQRRLLARNQETIERMGREDQAARASLAESEFTNSTEPELQAAWERAFDAGDTDRLRAITSVMTKRYGAGAANFVGKSLASRTDFETNTNRQASLRALQDHMLNDSNFAGFMRGKAADAYDMISAGGQVHVPEHTDAQGRRVAAHNEFRNLVHFSTEHNTATQDKDWATQSVASLERAFASNALKAEDAQRLLDSTDPAIQSGLQSDAKKRRILMARAYGHSGDWSDTNQVDNAVREYELGRARAEAEAEDRAREAEKQARAPKIVSTGAYEDAAGNVYRLREMSDGRFLDDHDFEVDITHFRRH